MTSSDKTSLESIKQEIKRYADSFGMLDSERAQHLGLPEGCRIRENAKILSQEKLTIGESCWIGEGAILDASGELEIGSHVSIGLNVMIWTHDSHQLNIRGKNNRDENARIKRKKTYRQLLFHCRSICYYARSNDRQQMHHWPNERCL